MVTDNTNQMPSDKDKDEFEATFGQVFEDIRKKQQKTEPPRIFDESDYYNKEIWPRMQELDKLCRDRGLPHMIWVISSHREDGATGNGLISATQHPCACKMAALANIADGTMSLSMLAKMAVLHSLMGGDEKLTPLY